MTHYERITQILKDAMTVESAANDLAIGTLQRPNYPYSVGDLSCIADARRHLQSAAEHMERILAALASRGITPESAWARHDAEVAARR